MFVLALDTALGATSVCVFDALLGRVLAEESVALARGHAEVLMPMVDRVLAHSGLDFKHIERFVVTIGPGSFTGLRIGIAAARAMALIHNRPVVGISTLAAFAIKEQFEAPLFVIEGQEPVRCPVAVAIDARHEAIFFEYKDAQGESLVSPGFYSLQKAAHFLEAPRVTFAGNAAIRLAAAYLSFSSPDNEKEAQHIAETIAPDIKWVAYLGVKADPLQAPAFPLYLREVNAIPQNQQRLVRV